tara:strand:+ start:3174 stop:3638 length:465 start_codon:yes stop_codon:yes gene_type:complete
MKDMRRLGKRGLSPVIATILLVSIALILAIIIFLWARQVVSEKIEKFEEPIENACDDTRFDAEASGGKVHIVNRGSVALYGVEIREKGVGKVETVKPFLEEGKTTISQGETESVDLPSGVENEIIVVPVILGETSSFKKAYVCDVDYGIETVVI